MNIAWTYPDSLLHAKNRMTGHPWLDEYTDALGFEAGDANLSRYVGNEPIASVDPSGLMPPEGLLDLRLGIDPKSQIRRARQLPPSVGEIVIGKLPSGEEREHLRAIIGEIRASVFLVPGGTNRCHRWVETLRDKMVARGKECYDNELYRIEYIEWRFPPKGGWIEHAGLRITFADGTVVYLDDGAINRRGISFPHDIPVNWDETQVQSLDEPKGGLPYATWEEIKALPRVLWDLIFRR